MSVSARDIDGERPAGRTDAWVGRAHEYVLPIAGACSTILGVSLALEPRLSAGPFVPLALVAVGVGALAGGLVRLAGHRSAIVTPPGSAERFAAETWVICPSCSTRSSGPAAPPLPGPASPVAPAAMPLLSASPAPGPADRSDLLWASWVPHVGRMPVGLIGPIAETAYVPHRPGTPTLYEEGEPLVLPGLAASTVRSADSWSAPSTQEDGSAPDESNGGDPGRDARPSEAEELRDDVDRWDDRSFAIAGAIGDPVLWEALNPIPPHRRPPSVPVTREIPEPSPPPFVPIRSDRCGNCDEPLTDPRRWRRCRECESPLCRECIVHALLTHERAWCARCAELLKLDTISPETARRPTRSTASTPPSASVLPFARPGDSGLGAVGQGAR